MKKHLLALSATPALAFALTAPAYALDQIPRMYQSIRSAGMGGVRTTTGLFDENFFTNPARATANPSSKFELLQTGFEVSSISNISGVLSNISGGDIVKSLGNTAGKDTHVRIQEEPVALFISPNENRKWAFGFGLFTSTQADVDLRQSFQIGAQGITDIGPAVTFAYKLLDDKLSVGATAHVVYRLATTPNFTFVQLLQGKSLSPLTNGGQGGMVDFDLGATYELPIWADSPFKMSVGAAIDNLLGGGYSNLKLNLVPGLTCSSSGSSSACLPPTTPRSFNLGVAVTRAEWGVFTGTSFAFEINDLGNNNNNVYGGSTPDDNVYGRGSLFRMLHLGAETHWKLIALRAGINQGYLTAGVGFDLRFFTLDLATYGEEMSLNTGGLEDRRYAIQFGFQI